MGRGGTKAGARRPLRARAGFDVGSRVVVTGGKYRGRSGVVLDELDADAYSVSGLRDLQPSESLRPAAIDEFVVGDIVAEVGRRFEGEDRVVISPDGSGCLVAPRYEQGRTPYFWVANTELSLICSGDGSAFACRDRTYDGIAVPTCPCLTCAALFGWITGKASWEHMSRSAVARDWAVFLVSLRSGEDWV